MKLRYLAPVVFLALTTVAAHAQSDNHVGLYLNPVGIRVSNSAVDSGPFAFLGPNSTSQVFYGFDLGAYYDFFHSGNLDAGLDVRESDLHANNALLRSFLVGARVSAHPFTRPFKPYFRVAEIGYGSLTTVSSATVGSGGNLAIPAANLISFSTGLVFRF